MARLLAHGWPGRVFYGWWIVAVFFLAECVTAGAGTFTFALYLKPMSEDLQWTRAMVVSAMTVRAGVNIVVSPIAGVLLDRYGPRAIMSFGAVVGGGALISLASVHHLWHWYLAYGLGSALGLGLTGTVVTQSTVAKWFVHKRGRAVAVTSAGIGFGAMIMTPVTQVLISTMGWRTAWLVFGLLTWALILPASALILRRTPEDMGLRPDGGPPMGGAQGTDSLDLMDEVSWTAAEAFRTRALWLMVAGFAISGLALSPILTHQAAYLTDRGFSDAVAAGVITAFAALTSVANLTWGFAAERVHVRFLISLSYVIAAAGVVLLIAAGGGSMGLLVIYVVVYGSTRNVAAMQGLAYANYWGRGFQGSIRGYVTPLNLLGSAGGPLLAAFIYDMTGSYLAAFSASVALFLVAAGLMLAATPPKKAP